MYHHLKTLNVQKLHPSVLLLLLLLASCFPKDICKNLDCKNGGACVDQQCICPKGYVGNFCEKLSRERYIANWVVTEDGSLTEKITYTAIIEAADEKSEIWEVVLKNLNNYEGPVKAVVDMDSLLIPEQSSTSKLIRGRGFFRGDSLMLLYQVHDLATNLTNDYGYDADNDNGTPSVWHK